MNLNERRVKGRGGCLRKIKEGLWPWGGWWLTRGKATTWVTTLWEGSINEIRASSFL